MAAEAVLSFPRAPFHGLLYIRLIRCQLSTKSRFVPRASEECTYPSPHVQALLCGYRRLCPELQYLSLWVFVRFYTLVRLPSRRLGDNTALGRLLWVRQGMCGMADADVKPQPGVHYVVRGPRPAQKCLPLPEIPSEPELRLMWVVEARLVHR